MSNLHHDPVDSAGQPRVTSVVRDQTITVIASTVRTSHPLPAATSPDTPADHPYEQESEPALRTDRTAELLTFGLTVICLALLGYIVTIDKTDLSGGIPTTILVMSSLTTTVFDPRNWVHRPHRIAAQWRSTPNPRPNR